MTGASKGPGVGSGVPRDLTCTNCGRKNRFATTTPYFPRGRRDQKGTPRQEFPVRCVCGHRSWSRHPRAAKLYGVEL